MRVSGFWTCTLNFDPWFWQAASFSETRIAPRDSRIESGARAHY
jgi:hypothetical protein